MDFMSISKMHSTDRSKRVIVWKAGIRVKGIFKFSEKESK